MQALSAITVAAVAVCTDAPYVYGGAVGSARRWKARGRRKSAGAVVRNMTLWEGLIPELDKQGRVVEWVKLPSDACIEGNIDHHRTCSELNKGYSLSLSLSLKATQKRTG